MPDAKIRHNLDELRQRYMVQMKNLQDEAQNLEAEIYSISAKLRKLETQRETASQKLYRIQQLLQGMHDTEKSETLDLILAHVLSCQRLLIERLGYSLDNRLELENQMQALLASDPSLSLALHEYETFNNHIDSFLADIPEYYRTRILDAHSSLKEKLSHILLLKSELEKCLITEPIDLPIVQAMDCDHNQVYWVFPSPCRVDGSNEKFKLRLNALENAFLQSMSLLTGEKETILPDFQWCEWAGYRGITTLTDEKDNTAIAELVEGHLITTLRQFWPFPDLNVQIQVIPLDWPLWVAGAEKEQFAEVDQESKAYTSFTSPNPLFTERDIVSWDRPLRVGEESLWTVHARRMRIMFIRMITQGRIGKLGLQFDALLSGLPAVHRDALTVLLPTLMDNEILVHEPSREEGVCINPVHLSDIQDLINRDITPFWVPIISGSMEPAFD